MPWPVPAASIDQAEAELNVRFPEDYRAGMARMNGGVVEALSLGCWLHPFLDTTDRKRLSRTSDHVVRATKSAREYADFPPGAVVVASIDCVYLVLLPSQLGEPPLRDEVWAWFSDGDRPRRVFESTGDLIEARE